MVIARVLVGAGLVTTVVLGAASSTHAQESGGPAEAPRAKAQPGDAEPGDVWPGEAWAGESLYFHPNLRRDDKLVSVAGVHVYSEAYKVAALGNITTHPAYRGQGLARIVTARLCRSLLETVDYIGLNVKVDNQSAISLYQRLGFEPVCTYHEYMVEAK